MSLRSVFEPRKRIQKLPAATAGVKVGAHITRYRLPRARFKARARESMDSRARTLNHSLSEAKARGQE